MTDEQPKRPIWALWRGRWRPTDTVRRRLPGLPHSLRGKLLLFSLVVVSVPIITAGYLLEREGQQTLLQEKQARLFGLDRLLDAQLGSGFDDLLSDYAGDKSDRGAVIRHLTARLTTVTDQMAAANPVSASDITTGRAMQSSPMGRACSTAAPSANRSRPTTPAGR